MDIPTYPISREVGEIESEDFYVGVLVDDSNELNQPLGVFYGTELRKYQKLQVKHIFPEFLHQLLEVDISMHPVELVEQFRDAGAEWALVREKGQIVGYVSEKQMFMTLYKAFFEDHQILTEMQRSLQLKDDYIAMLAHDIRAPLQVITLCCDYLKRTKNNPNMTPEDEEEFLSRISMNTSKANGLVSSILDLESFGKQEQKKLNLVQKDLVEFLEAIARNLQVIAARKRITIETKLLPGLIAEIDEIRFAQIIENLIGNAIKFSPRDKNIWIETCVKKKKDNDYLRVSIKDEGHGIPDKQLQSVFAKFQQLDNPKDVKESGVGLGLSIAKQYALLHNGQIEVENLKEGGVAFHVDIPDPNSEVSKKIREAQNAPKRLLVVDDDPDVVDFISEFLKEEGYEVDVAFDGEEALKKFKMLSHKMVISDIKMPEMDGIDLLQNVKQIDEEVGFILISGFYPSIDNDMAKSVFKIDKFFRKPFNPTTLLKVVEDYINPEAKKAS